MRIVLDTSVLVAGLRSPDGASRLWIEAAIQERFKLLISVPLVLQYEDVLTRPENLKVFNLNERDIGVLLDAICHLGEEIELSYLWRPLLRDPGDEMVLETAVLGKADALLTFNVRDFLGAERIGVRIEQPGPAWRNMKARLS